MNCENLVRSPQNAAETMPIENIKTWMINFS